MTEVVPIVPSGTEIIESSLPVREGKPKAVPQISAAIRWCLTLNNYTEEDCKSISSIVLRYCRYAIIGKEIAPTTGTPHLQGYIEFKKKNRPMSVFNFTNRIRWTGAEKAREANFRYCKKEADARGEEVWLLHPKPRTVTTIKKDEFYPWQLELYNIFKEKPKWDCRNIYWFYSPEYGTGKTQFCKYMKVHMKAVIIDGEKKHMLAQVQNSYSDIYIVLLCKGDNIVSYRALEKIKDGLFSTHFGCDNNKDEARDAPHLLIMGNEPPDRRDEHFHPTKYKVFNLQSSKWE
ncbi:MAG: putative viral replication protein [Cressdnaviricota sp.]|nr:MAG: putative viral replication protein [Cressdnaviricota sp.]